MCSIHFVHSFLQFLDLFQIMTFHLKFFFNDNVIVKEKFISMSHSFMFGYRIESLGAMLILPFWTKSIWIILRSFKKNVTMNNLGLLLCRIFWRNSVFRLMLWLQCAVVNPCSVYGDGTVEEPHQIAIEQRQTPLLSCHISTFEVRCEQMRHPYCG